MEERLNMHNKQVAVVIPIHKSQLSEYEMISLKQVCTVLGEYDIVAVVPNGLTLAEREAYTRIESFAVDYFKSITDYNRLMLSPSFYRRFWQYEYILIYQLDAFVFADKLSWFCQQGYDYIGAPWLYGIFNYIDAEHSIFHVGNGGLSLRRISSFIKLLEERQPLLDEQIKNEDLFFSSIVSPEFRIAPLEIALQFSFERQVETCYERNHYELPFGCHAWERYNLPFWKPYIEQEGYVLQANIESVGNEDITRRAEYDSFARLSAFFENGFDKGMLKQKLESRLETIRKSFVIFGAGFSGKALMRWLVDIGVPVRGFCDNNRKLVGESLLGYPIFRVSEISSFKEEIFIVIANLEHEVSMANQLLESGFVRKKDYITFTDFVDLLYEDVSR